MGEKIILPVLVGILILGTLGLSQDIFGLPFDPTPVEIPNPTPFEFDQFGFFVATNGQDIVIGAPSLKASAVFGPGSAFLFDNTGSLTRELVRPSPQSLETFGRTVALDDTTIVIGATGVSSASGSSYEFDLTSLPNAGDFSTEYSNPLPTPADNFGLGLDVLGDFVLVGAQLDDTSGFDAGIAHLFKRTAPFTVTTILKPAGFNQFGIDAVLGSDFLVIGAPRSVGQVHIFDYDDDGSVTLSTTLANPGPCCQFGVALAVDGDNIVVGAVNSQSGKAYLFDKSGTLITTFKNPDFDVDQFGFSVDISGDLVVIGAIRDDTGAADAGSVYVFDITTCDADTSNGGAAADNICEAATQTINNPFPASGEFFGISVSLAGDILVIGAPGHDSNPEESGVAYLYTASPPPITEVSIDIKPGSDPNSVNCKANKKGIINGVVPIGISTDGFDAASIDPDNLTLNDDDTSEVHGTVHIEDSTAVIHVSTSAICAATSGTGDVDVTLGGSNDEGDFEGTDTVRIVKR